MPPYRQNVAAILIDATDRILVAERLDVDGAWQFPQGGVDCDESVEQALAREVEEELGLGPQHYRVETRRGGYRYEFPRRSRRWDKYQGQEQTYFLCRIEEAAQESINVDTEHPEFRRVQWIRPGDFRMRWLPDFKKEVYAAVLADFFGVKELRA